MDNDDGEHLLSGYKWFTSASDADMALTLARSFDAEGWPIPVSAAVDAVPLMTFIV